MLGVLPHAPVYLVIEVYVPILVIALDIVQRLKISDGVTSIHQVAVGVLLGEDPVDLVLSLLDLLVELLQFLQLLQPCHSTAVGVVGCRNVVLECWQQCWVSILLWSSAHTGAVVLRHLIS